MIDILKSTAKIHPEIAKALGKNDEIVATIKNIKRHQETILQKLMQNY